MLDILVSYLLIIVISFICSLCEAVLLSLSPAFVAVEIDGYQKRKKTHGRILQNVTDHMNRSLSAILTLNTISHTLGSAWITFLIHAKYGDQWVTISSVFLTILILFVSEIIPKTIGKNNAKSLAMFAAFATQIMIVLLYPIVKVSEAISKRLSNVSEEPDVTRDEMIKNAEIGVEEGTLKSKESMIIKNLMKLDKIFVSDIMTPRSVITAIPGNMTVSDVYEKYKPIRFSRIPVYDESFDNIIGLTHRYKILEAMSQDLHNKLIRELVVPITLLSERITVSQALDFFVKEKTHLAIVNDEYGVMTGLVTLEDAVETLLGVEIVDEFDTIEDMRKYALDQWQQRKKTLRY
jgi:CBS domain containing-hemolysin-like protein